MALLNGTNLHPPDGWRYLQPETELWIQADLYDELLDAVIAHRTHKGLTPTDRETVGLEVQRQMCLGAAKGVCRPESGEDYQPFKDNARKLSLDKITAATKTLVEWLKSDMRMVPPADSAKRSEVCRGCPFNRPIPNCVCTGFWRLIDVLIPKERKEHGLYVCGICGCSLAAKVLAPLDVATSGNEPGLRLPDWCWQRTEAA